jgi:hypothetical protein
MRFSTVVVVSFFKVGAPFGGVKKAPIWGLTFSSGWIGIATFGSFAIFGDQLAAFVT